jgi:hypothetical protein
VATRTDADVCPSCGKPYVRRPLRWRWWLAIPIIIAAFGIGYGGRMLIQGDSESEGITLQQGQAARVGISPSELDARLDGESPSVVKHRGAGATCRYYAIADRPQSVWEFCFADGKLVASKPVGSTK